MNGQREFLNDRVKQAIISFISTVWEKEFRNDEHDPLQMKTE